MFLRGKSQDIWIHWIDGEKVNTFKNYNVESVILKRIGNFKFFVTVVFAVFLFGLY